MRRLTLMQLDRRLMGLILRAQAAPLAPVAVASSHVGRGGLVWFALAPLVGAGKRPLPRRHATALSAIAVGSALAVSALLARTFERARPCHRGIRSLIPCPDGGAMPSDQAAAAFAAAHTLGWLQPGARIWVWPLAALIAVSRVAVGAHYPTDVLAGAAIGTTLGRLATTAAERRSPDPADEGGRWTHRG